MKKLFFLVFLLVLALAAGTALKIHAGTAVSGRGWFWGGSNDGAINTGLGWISMNDLNPTAGGAVSYGVNIPLVDGNLSGYAWSSNLGWIDFAPIGPYPAAPNYSAMRSGNTLEGWARFSDIAQESARGNSGGWDGWISLKGTATDGITTYGVAINPVTNQLSGFAWSYELGYIDFTGASINVVVVNDLKVCSGSCGAGTLISSGSTQSMFASGTMAYKACYNSSVVCDSAAGDVTNDASTTWGDTNSPNDVVSFPSKGSLQAGSAMGSEGVTVNYNPGILQTVSFSVQVNAAPAIFCGNGVTETGEACDDGANNGTCPKICSASCASNSCGGGSSSNWREVAP